MTRLQFDLQVPVKYTGTLALLGTKDEDDQTCVYFMCQCPWEEPLAQYFHSWYADGKNMLDTITQEVEAVDFTKYHLVFFVRRLEGPLRDPAMYLRVTARQLLRTLQKVEDAQLSYEELCDELNWLDDHLFDDRPMPARLSLPRHQ